VNKQPEVSIEIKRRKGIKEIEKSKKEEPNQKRKGKE
jgi:hypothetical protein